MKKTWVPIVGCVAMLGGVCGCPAPAPQQPVTVQLVNQTGLDVTPNLHVSSGATTSDGLFGPQYLVTDFTTRAFPELRAKETITLSFECDQLRSLGVDKPVSFDAVSLAVTNSTDRVFAVRGTNFNCGDTVRLVYFNEGELFRVRIE